MNRRSDGIAGILRDIPPRPDIPYRENACTKQDPGMCGNCLAFAVERHDNRCGTITYVCWECEMWREVADIVENRRNVECLALGLGRHNDGAWGPGSKNVTNLRQKRSSGRIVNASSSYAYGGLVYRL